MFRASALHQQQPLTEGFKMMKRLTLSVFVLALATAAFVPTAHASRSQVSTPDELGEGTSFVEFVWANRAARRK